MASPTRRVLRPADVATLVRASLGPGTTVVDCAELTGGGFAAVWRADLGDGRAVVVKVAPPPSVRLLRYEHDLTAAEAAYFRLVRSAVPGVPVPEVLHHGRDPRHGEWLVTACLPGTALPELERTRPGVDHAPVRRELGAAVRALHAVTGPRFGYPGTRAHGATWPRAFTAMVDDVLADAADWAVALPRPAPAIRDLVTRHGAALRAVRRPALVHFDLWDGNVLASVDHAGRARLTGLVDGERHLFGDPLVDFASAALYRRMEDEPGQPFLHGYGPVRFDPAARRRLSLYRMYLYLVMTVEMPSRGMTAPADRAWRERVTALLAEQLDDLDGRWPATGRTTAADHRDVPRAR